MKLWNVPAEELTRIVTTVSNEAFDGNVVFKREPERTGRAVSFTLTVRKAADKGGRRGHSGRRVCACCWHGHRDVMSAIFAEYPDARLKTAQADYRGRDEFEAEFEGTGYANIGSMVEPLHYRDACDCNE